MYAFNNKHYLGSLLALGVCTKVMGASATSGVFEVDLIFPRNETYAPSEEMPLVFAVQNPHLVAPLQVDVSWFISPYRDYVNITEPSQFDSNSISSSDSDPYFLYNKTDAANTEGIWEVTWFVNYGYCEGTSGEPLFYTQNSTTSQVVFTVKNGAAEPDLTAATKKGACGTAIAAWNVTGTLDAEESADWGFDKCAVISRKSPWATVDPCAVKFDAATASNISASLNISTGGKGSTDGKDSDGKDSDEKDPAADNASAVHLPVGVTSLTALFAGLTYILA